MTKSWKKKERELGESERKREMERVIERPKRRERGEKNGGKGEKRELEGGRRKRMDANSSCVCV